MGSETSRPDINPVADEFLEGLNELSRAGAPIFWGKHSSRPEPEVEKGDEGASVEASTGASSSRREESGKNTGGPGPERPGVFGELMGATLAAAEAVRDATTFGGEYMEWGTQVYESVAVVCAFGTSCSALVFFSYVEPYKGRDATPAERKDGIVGVWEPQETKLPPGAQPRVNLHSHPNSTKPSSEDVDRTQGGPPWGGKPMIVVTRHKQYFVYIRQINKKDYEEFHREPTF